MTQKERMIHDRLRVSVGFSGGGGLSSVAFAAAFGAGAVASEPAFPGAMLIPLVREAAASAAMADGC